MKKSLVVICGPTGVGKTDISTKLAKTFQTEIVSCDSRQMYKELKIGTAVPTEHQLKEVPHHFIGNISIHDYFNASMYEFAALDLLNELFKKYDVVFMVGGSGLYIDAFCHGIDDLPTVDKETRAKFELLFREEGLEGIRHRLKMVDPDYYRKVDLRNHKRILKALEISDITGKPYSKLLTSNSKKRDFNIIKIGLNRDREELYDRINQRVENMVEMGLVEEAKRYSRYQHLNAMNTVGYKELFSYFSGAVTFDESIDLIKRHTRKYARKQITWFRRYNDLVWFHPENGSEIIRFINEKKRWLSE